MFQYLLFTTSERNNVIKASQSRHQVAEKTLVVLNQKMPNLLRDGSCYSRLFLSSSNLGLSSSANLLGSVLPFLLLLTAGLCLGLDDSLSDKAVLGLELLGEIHGVVNQAEPSGLVTSEVGLEPECENSVGCAVVHLGQLLTDICLRHRSLAWVEDIHNHLAPAVVHLGQLLTDICLRHRSL